MAACKEQLEVLRASLLPYPITNFFVNMANSVGGGRDYIVQEMEKVQELAGNHGGGLIFLLWGVDREVNRGYQGAGRRVTTRPFIQL